MDIDGFKDGYLKKEAAVSTILGGSIPLAAGTGAMAARAGGWSADKLKALLILAPVLLGIGAGASVSKLTRPSATDAENLQKSLISAEMEEALAELKRKKSFAQEEESSSTEREIRF